MSAETWSPDTLGSDTAIVVTVCGHSGDSFRLRVPHAHRHTSLGWHGRKLIRWPGDDGPRHGYEVARGVRGVTVRDEVGDVHRLDHGYFEDVEDADVGERIVSRDLFEDMAKGRDLKPGQRWITVHPNGKDEKGVPVLIGDNGDGTWSVVAGAGGKLQHLRLRNVKSEEEHAEAAKVRAKERRAAEKDRRSKQTVAEQGQEREAKADVKAAKMLRERHLIDVVRKHAGGVDEDLDPEKLAGLPGGARNLVIARHHAKQLRQAIKRKDEALKRLVRDRAHDQQVRSQVEQRVAEDPSLTRARELAEAELQQRDRENEERRAERRARRTRVTTGESKVGEKASDAALEALETIEAPEEKLDALGGDDATRKANVLSLDLKASQEVERRGLQAMVEAKALAKAATGGDLTKREQSTVDRIREQYKLEDADLAREAGRRLRRAQEQEARAARMREIEAEHGEHVAEQSLAYSDMIGGIASSAAAAKRMGLTTAEHVPMTDPETAEVLEMLGAADELRQARKEFAALNKDVEAGNYKAARKAYDIEVSADTAKIEQTVQDEIQRELAESIRGVADRKRSAFMESCEVGKYDALADVGLSIGGQRYIDRPVVDAIGHVNAAVLMRHGLEQDGHERKDVLGALEANHLREVSDLSHKALQKANEFVPGLTDSVEDVGDIERVLATIDVHEESINEAQRAVGAALGRMEGLAGIAQAWRGAMPDALTIPTGDQLSTTLQWLHSVGLTDKGRDFTIDAGKKEIQVPRSAWGKLMNRLDAAEVERRAKARAIRAGEHDEDGFLPQGIVSRAESTFTAQTPAAASLREPLDLSGDLDTGIRDHVGSRLADGEQPHEILRDLLGPGMMGAASDKAAYTEKVRELFPLVGEDGRTTKYEDHADHFRGLAEDFMTRRHGDVAGAFHAQDIGVDDKGTHEAVFRALNDHPRAAVAFKGTADLDHRDRAALRDHFHEIMGIDPSKRVDEARFRRKWMELGQEPDKNKGTLSLFNTGGPSPEWREWAAKRDAILKAHPRAGLETAIASLGDNPDPAKVEALKQAAAQAPTAWERFVQAHGSLELAQRSLQDDIRGRFLSSYVDHHGKVTGRALKSGVAEVANRERHVIATAGEDEAAKLRAEAQAMQAKLRDRVGGRFAAEGKGAVREKHTRFLEQSTIAAQNQGGLFGSMRSAPVEGAAAKAEPGVGERLTIGARAEEQLASIVPKLAAQFSGGRGVKLFAGLNMDGDRVHQQRVVKMLDEGGGRVLAALGTGSGKSLIAIGSTTDQILKGKAKHGVFAVPKAVEDQFPGEMLRFTEPGRFKWATGSSMTHEQRVEALRDTNVHMKVMTHEALRDTLLRVMADHHREGDVAKMKSDLAGASTQVRAGWMREAMAANGIEPWFFVGDEAHRFTQRGEGAASGLHAVMSAAHHPDNASHAMFGTATPVKNDESEVYSTAAALDPVRYGDRHTFMQNFGSSMGHAPTALRRELGHMVYSARIDPEGVQRRDSDNPQIHEGEKRGSTGGLKLDDSHQARVDRVGELYKRARAARQDGDVDIDAVRELSPKRFAGQPREKWEGIARGLSRSLGVVRESAMRRAVNGVAPDNVKSRRLVETVKHDLEHGTWTDRDGATQKGKASVIFTDRATEARELHAELSRQGVRAALYHGGLGSKERERVRLGFQPEDGSDPTHDVVIATSAAEAGINMQRAKVIHHYDVPMTEKSHNQRSGRAYRQGQQGDVDVHNWHTDTDYEQSGRRRLMRKEGLASVFQDPITNLDDTGLAHHYQAALAARHQGREV